MNSLLGADVSHHNGIVNFSAIKAIRPEFSFVYAKASQGSTFVDKERVNHHRRIKAANLYAGFYHFMTTTSDPKTQVQNYLNCCSGFDLDLTPMLDIEWVDGLKSMGETLASYSLYWLQAIEGITGEIPIIYTNKNFFKASTATLNKFAKYPLWVADYSKTATPGIPYPWSKYDIWQYTDGEGLPAGDLLKNLDLNIFHGTPYDLLNLGKNGTIPTKFNLNPSKIIELQEFINSTNYTPQLKIDGVKGPKTIEALQAIINY